MTSFTPYEKQVLSLLFLLEYFKSLMRRDGSPMFPQLMRTIEWCSRLQITAAGNRRSVWMNTNATPNQWNGNQQKTPLSTPTINRQYPYVSSYELDQDSQGCYSRLQPGPPSASTSNAENIYRGRGSWRNYQHNVSRDDRPYRRRRSHLDDIYFPNYEDNPPSKYDNSQARERNLNRRYNGRPFNYYRGSNPRKQYYKSFTVERHRNSSGILLDNNRSITEHDGGDGNKADSKGNDNEQKRHNVGDASRPEPLIRDNFNILIKTDDHNSNNCDVKDIKDDKCAIKDAAASATPDEAVTDGIIKTTVEIIENKSQIEVTKSVVNSNVDNKDKTNPDKDCSNTIQCHDIKQEKRTEDKCCDSPSSPKNVIAKETRTKSPELLESRQSPLKFTASSSNILLNLSPQPKSNSPDTNRSRWAECQPTSPYLSPGLFPELKFLQEVERVPPMAQRDADEDVGCFDDFITIRNIDTTQSFLPESPKDDYRVIDMDMGTPSPVKRKTDDDSEEVPIKKHQMNDLLQDADFKTDLLLLQINEVLNEDKKKCEIKSDRSIKMFRSKSFDVVNRPVKTCTARSKSVDRIVNNQSPGLLNFDLKTNLLLLLTNRNEEQSDLSDSRNTFNDIKKSDVNLDQYCRVLQQSSSNNDVQQKPVENPHNENKDETSIARNKQEQEVLRRKNTSDEILNVNSKPATGSNSQLPCPITNKNLIIILDQHCKVSQQSSSNDDVHEKTAENPNNESTSSNKHQIDNAGSEQEQEVLKSSQFPGPGTNGKGIVNLDQHCKVSQQSSSKDDVQQKTMKNLNNESTSSNKHQTDNAGNEQEQEGLKMKSTSSDKILNVNSKPSTSSNSQFPCPGTSGKGIVNLDQHCKVSQQFSSKNDVQQKTMKNLNNERTSSNKHQTDNAGNEQEQEGLKRKSTSSDKALNVNSKPSTSSNSQFPCPGTSGKVNLDKHCKVSQQSSSKNDVQQKTMKNLNNESTSSNKHQTDNAGNEQEQEGLKRKSTSSDKALNVNSKPSTSSNSQIPCPGTSGKGIVNLNQHCKVSQQSSAKDDVQQKAMKNPNNESTSSNKHQTDNTGNKQEQEVLKRRSTLDEALNVNSKPSTSSNSQFPCPGTSGKGIVNLDQHCNVSQQSSTNDDIQQKTMEIFHNESTSSNKHQTNNAGNKQEQEVLKRKSTSNETLNVNSKSTTSSNSQFPCPGTSGKAIEPSNAYRSDTRDRSLSEKKTSGGEKRKRRARSPSVDKAEKRIKSTIENPVESKPRPITLGEYKKIMDFSKRFPPPKIDLDIVIDENYRTRRTTYSSADELLIRKMNKLFGNDDLDEEPTVKNDSNKGDKTDSEGDKKLEPKAAFCKPRGVDNVKALDRRIHYVPVSSNTNDRPCSSKHGKRSHIQPDRNNSIEMDGRRTSIPTSLVSGDRSTVSADKLKKSGTEERKALQNEASDPTKRVDPKIKNHPNEQSCSTTPYAKSNVEQVGTDKTRGGNKQAKRVTSRQRMPEKNKSNNDKQCQSDGNVSITNVNTERRPIDNGVKIIARVPDTVEPKSTVTPVNDKPEKPITVSPSKLISERTNFSTISELCFIKCIVLSQERFPMQLKARHNLVESECCDKAIVLDNPEAYDDIIVVKQSIKTSVGEESTKIEESDVVEVKQYIPIIDLTDDDACVINEKRDVNRSGQDVGMCLSKSDDPKCEIITLYRSEETLNNSLDVQAMVASISSTALVNKENNILKIARDDAVTTDSRPAGHGIQAFTLNEKEPAAKVQVDILPITNNNTCGASSRRLTPENASKSTPQNHSHNLAFSYVEKAINEAIKQREVQMTEQGRDEGQAKSCAMFSSETVPPPNVSIDDLRETTVRRVVGERTAAARTLTNAITVDRLQETSTPSRVADNTLMKPPSSYSGSQILSASAKKSRNVGSSYEIVQTPRRMDNNDHHTLMMVPRSPRRTEDTVTITSIPRRTEGTVGEPTFVAGQIPGCPAQSAKWADAIEPPQVQNDSSRTESTNARASVEPASSIVSENPDQSPGPMGRENRRSSPVSVHGITSQDINKIGMVFIKYLCFFDGLKNAQKAYIYELNKYSRFLPKDVSDELMRFDSNNLEKLCDLARQLVADLSRLNLTCTTETTHKAQALIEATFKSLRPVLPHLTLTRLYLMLEALIVQEKKYYLSVPLLKALHNVVELATQKIRRFASGQQQEDANINPGRDVLSVDQRKRLELQISQYKAICAKQNNLIQEQELQNNMRRKQQGMMSGGNVQSSSNQYGSASSSALQSSVPNSALISLLNYTNKRHSKCCQGSCNAQAPTQLPHNTNGLAVHSNILASALVAPQCVDRNCSDDAGSRKRRPSQNKKKQRFPGQSEDNFRIRLPLAVPYGTVSPSSMTTSAVVSQNLSLMQSPAAHRIAQNSPAHLCNGTEETTVRVNLPNLTPITQSFHPTPVYAPMLFVHRRTNVASPGPAEESPAGVKPDNPGAVSEPTPSTSKDATPAAITQSSDQSSLYTSPTNNVSSSVAEKPPIPVSSQSTTPAVGKIDLQDAGEPTSSTPREISNKDNETAVEEGKESQNDIKEMQMIDLTWVDNIDPKQLQSEIECITLKKEEPVEEEEEIIEGAPDDPVNVHMQGPIPVMPSPSDSGIASPAQIEYNEQVFSDRTCICGTPAEYVCGCITAMYCSEACQLKDWKTHKEICLKSNARNGCGSKEGDQEIDDQEI